jgi:hypothetical protein
MQFCKGLDMKIFPLCFMIFFSLSIGYADAQEAQESVKIQYLISSIKDLKGAKFIRNGEEYDTDAATDHLRLKLRSAGKHVKTADDFIRLCGSKSSVSGKPYQIRFSDGTTLETEVFFRKRLKALNNKAAP